MKARLAIFVGALAVFLYGLYSFVLVKRWTPTKVSFPHNGYFGKGKERPDDTSIVPFQINVPNATIQDLKNRLKASRIGHAQLEDVDNFEYGFNLATLRQFQDHWLNRFDWRKQETLLNQFKQYTTEIEGLKVHYIHVKPPQSSKYKRVVPLLLVHGWPGNVFEFYKVIPVLADPNKYAKAGSANSDLAFEVVVPSIPGFGWSEQPHKKGFNQVATARIFHKLMTDRLKLGRYIAQGGDWGSLVASHMGRMYPDRVLGVHLNAIPSVPSGFVTLVQSIVGSFAPRLVFSSPAFASYNLMHIMGEFVKESGYYHIQSTKPDTVGVGLNDSPLGLMAYILEKFSTWTNPMFRSMADGGLERKFTKDELLTVVSIYWFNENILSSQRYYKEFFNGGMDLTSVYVSVPVGYALFPLDLWGGAPVEMARNGFNITHHTVFNDGGHFAAFEMPNQLAEDILEFARKTD